MEVGKPGHLGAWRAACAVPAMLTSAVLVAIVAALLGRLAVAGLATWVAAGFVLLHPRGERAAARTALRLRAPVDPEAAWLASLQVWAEHRCGVTP